MRTILSIRKRGQRRGAVLALSVILLIVMLAFVAFAVDLGYICVTRSQLQNAADAAAMAAASYIPNDAEEALTEAQRFAGAQIAGGQPLRPESVELEFGGWDPATKTFTPSPNPGNAVRVTCERSTGHGGEVALFFAPVIGHHFFAARASAVAMTNPRDIAFVIDLSGSMNNDTEPCWATSEINATFGPEGYPTIGNTLMQQLYTDLNFGTFPGTLQYVGQPLGVAQDAYAYAEMTKNSGPLTQSSIPSAYKISSSDSEATRKTKAYKWMVDYQIAPLMPNAKPTPSSSNASSLAYWTRYLDYIMKSQQIKSSSAKGKPRPSYPVTLPPSQSSDQITGMGNPYYDAFPDASSSTVIGYQNKIGYQTYVQFMMDFGLDKQPASGQYVQLSRSSANCRWHDEATDGGTFSFPPSEQPTHAAKRAVIAAIKVIKDRNDEVTDPNQRDWVSIITFDRVAGTQIVRTLTSDYDAAMAACTNWQAVADDTSSTATETGLIAAKNHIKPTTEGGQGRRYTNKVVVFLTDGIPNLYSSSSSTITNYINAHPSGDFFPSSDYAENAALMQCMSMQLNRWQVFPVGLGLGANYDFMDRSARLGGTADESGEGPRGSGNPAEYEQRLKTIFENIISNPKARLVQ